MPAALDEEEDERTSRHRTTALDPDAVQEHPDALRHGTRQDAPYHWDDVTTYLSFLRQGLRFPEQAHASVPSGRSRDVRTPVRGSDGA